METVGTEKCLSPEKCLFCCGVATTFKRLSSSFSSLILTLTNEEQDTNQLMPASDKGSKKSLCETARNQLGPIFIVRKLLDLPVEKCAEYLERNDGVADPMHWFSVCESCFKRVVEGYRVYWEMKKVKRKLERVKNNLKQLIVKEAENRASRTSKDCGGIRKENFVHLDIRNYVISSANQSGLNEEDDTERKRKTRRSCIRRQKPTIKKSELPPSLQPRLRRRPEFKNATNPEVLNDACSPPVPKIQKVRKKYIYKCDLCVAKYPNPTMLKSHKKLHQDDNLGVPCPYCGWFCAENNLPHHYGQRHYGKSKKGRQRLLRQGRLDLIQNNELIFRKTDKRTENNKFEYKTMLKRDIPYYCDHCHMIFTSINYLLKHIKLHHPDTPKMLCKICNSDGEGFETRQLLELHCKEEHPTKIEEESLMKTQHDCQYCTETFNSTLERDYHVGKVHKDELLTCSKCGHKSDKYCNYLIHQRQRHGDGDLNKSTVFPPPGFENISEDPEEEVASNDQDISTEEGHFDEDEYNYNFNDDDQDNDDGDWKPSSPEPGTVAVPNKETEPLRRSMRKRRKKKIKRSKPVKTRVLKPKMVKRKIIISKKPLLRVSAPTSKDENAQKPEIPYYCDDCHMIFCHVSYLRNHRKLYHPEVSNVFCQICGSDGEGFETKQLLELHCKEEHPTKMEVETMEDPQEDCEHCSETFHSKLERDYHIAKFHKDKLLTCKDCGHKSDKYSSYMIHRRQKHDDGQRLMCEKCAKSFATEHYLRLHMSMLHNMYSELGVEPLKCNDCNMTFSGKNMLNSHMKGVHQKIKQHFCEYCGKGFIRSGDLNKHILLHTKPREEQYKKGPFFCEFCEAKFNVRQGLYYHLKKRHGDKYLFKCENCGTGYTTQNTLAMHKRKCKGKLGSSPSTSSSLLLSSSSLIQVANIAKVDEVTKQNVDAIISNTPIMPKSDSDINLMNLS